MGDKEEESQETAEVETTPPITEEKTIPFKEYQNLQREVAKREARIKDLETGFASLSEIREEVARLREDNASLYDRISGTLTPEDSETTSPSRVEALKSEREKETKERDSKLGKYQAVVETLLTDSGIDPQDPKLELARAHWKAGDLEKSVTEVKRVTKEAKTSKDNTVLETLIEERAKALVDKALADAGLKKFPGGQPSGQTEDWRELREKYIANPRDPEIRAKWLKRRNSR